MLKEGDRVVFIVNGVLERGVINALSSDKTTAIVSNDNIRKKLYTKDLAKEEPQEEPTEEKQEDELEIQEVLVTYHGLKDIISKVGAELCTKLMDRNMDIALSTALITAYILNETLDKLFKDCDIDD